MSGLNYLDYYFEFQKKFKPVKYYFDQTEIVKNALQILVGILTDSRISRTDFVRNIRLVYPNYFTEGDKGQYEPIQDDLIFFNSEDVKEEYDDLRSRVLQHMSYYLTSKDPFIRISQSLLENEKLNVSSFYVEKAEVGKKYSKTDDEFLFYINGVFDVSFKKSPTVIKDSSGKSTYKYPIDILSSNRDERFEIWDDGEDNSKYKDYIFKFKSSGTQAPSLPVPKDSQIRVVSDFYKVFEVPLSAHFVMLKNTSLLYVYSQTAQIGKDNRSLGYGGMFVLLKKGLDLETVKEYTRFFQLISDCISICIAHNIMREKQLKESIKSAISAIMSRNMSHNLGSHYLYYTKNHLERLANVISNEHSPDIRGAARVLGYTQARMDYLATIISSDKYPYGSVNFKSQVFDELTVDDFSKRHFINGKERRTINFLLSNLIRSEDFTRPCIKLDGEQNPDNLDLLKLQVKYTEDNIHYSTFTGTNFIPDDADDPEDYEGVPTMASEEKIKKILSHVNLALPGGIMSRHALFNVIENFVRNSAKYLREDFYREDGHQEKILMTNIVLRYVYPEKKYVEIIIYDNKENATFYKLLKRTIELDNKIQAENLNIPSFVDSKPNIEKIKAMGPIIIDQLKCSAINNKKEILKTAKSVFDAWQKECLFDQINKRLGSIQIVNENNSLEKENKGLKEMMFSVAWMRLYTFPAGKTYTDIIFNIQQEKRPEEKLKLIKKYCFSPVLVSENGDSLTVLKGEEGIESILFKPMCFGLSFTLPIFRRTTELKIRQDETSMIRNCLDTYSDIILADINADCPLDLKKTFTKIYPISDTKGKSETQILKEILRYRFKNFDDYCLSFNARCESSGIHDEAHLIKFDNHMADHVSEKSGLESQLVYAYSDSVSGGNFTKTMNELFDAALDREGNYKSEEEEYFALQIKESALTRITIIDERLYDSMERGGTQLELSLKNIRILNYRDSDVISSINDLFVGNSFKDNNDRTNFLSIHLGLVEKIIQSTEFQDFVGIMSLEQRAVKLMDLLRTYFGGDDVFISIHSGRGNFSAELEGPLASYPFITMSSLENTFNNSKFQLSQLFYNTVYIGKGKINNPQIS